MGNGAGLLEGVIISAQRENEPQREKVYSANPLALQQRFKKTKKTRNDPICPRPSVK